MINPKNLIGLDAIGALVSCLFIGGLMIPFQSYIGIPLSLLTSLALLAALFCLHSSLAYFRYPQSYKMHLRVMALGNLLYTLFTIGILILFHHQISLIGRIYFLIELSILCILVILEWRYAK